MSPDASTLHRIIIIITSPPFMACPSSLTSYIQFLLPPVAPLVRYGVHNRSDACGVEVDDVGSIAIYRKHWERRPAWLAIDSEACDVLLKCHSNRVTRHRSAGSIEERVGNVLAMEGGRYTELICVGLVVKGFIKIEGVAPWEIVSFDCSGKRNFHAYVKVDSEIDKSTRPVSSEYPVVPSIPGIFGG